MLSVNLVYHFNGLTRSIFICFTAEVAQWVSLRGGDKAVNALLSAHVLKEVVYCFIKSVTINNSLLYEN